MTRPLVDSSVRLFHLTAERNAANILRVGFLDGTGRYMTEAEYSGVWLTNDPDRIEGAKGDTLLVVDLDLEPAELDQFEWKDQRGYREWLIPSDYLQAHITALKIDGGDE